MEDKSATALVRKSAILYKGMEVMVRGVSFPKKYDSHLKEFLDVYSAHTSASVIEVELEKLGWKRLGNGCCKVAFLKGTFVAKFSKFHPAEGAGEIRKEWEQFYHANKHLRSMLARSYGYVGNQKEGKVLFQEYVQPSCPYRNQEDGWQKCPSNKAANKYTLSDWHHNHGHDEKGRVRFFDLVKWDFK